MAFSKTLKEKKLLIQCDSCFRDITSMPFVRCAECVWDQCLLCSLENEEGGRHVASHSFRLVHGLDKPLFEEGWRVIDELLLINGLVSFGIGNFEDIAAIIPSKTEFSVRKHFYKLVGIEESTQGESRELGSDDENAPLPPFRSDPNDKEVLSYMPQRKEFESELFNDYEALLEEIDSGTGTGLPKASEKRDGVDEELKKYILKNYRAILKQRAMWRNMIIDRNLVKVNAIKSHEGTILGNTAAKWRWLLQLISKNDFNSFVNGLVKEKLLKDQIESGECEQNLDERRLFDLGKMLSAKEKELCERLKLPPRLYTRLKRLSIECYVARKPLRETMFRFFDPVFHERLDVLYNWFQRQKIVYSPPSPVVTAEIKKASESQ